MSPDGLSVNGVGDIRRTPTPLKTAFHVIDEIDDSLLRKRKTPLVSSMPLSYSYQLPRRPSRRRGSSTQKYAGSFHPDHRSRAPVV